MGAPAIQKPAIQKMDIDEFLAWADRQEPDTRYELVGGQPRAMNACSQAHSQIAANVVYEVRRRLRPPCRVLSEAAIERDDRADRFYEADIAVTCSPHQPGQRSTPNPVLVVEILSDSTASHDRGTKVPDYMQIPSVQEVLLVDSRAVRAQLWRRDGRRWIVEDFTDDATLPLASIGAELPLAALYDGIAL
ncbi:Uma2 family endonuclease [Azospirillum argentinense]|uniref:Uma2 family endonuclease n=1 Tax=Azospirillum brasilense TaxID=192 RepID=A0A4D8Q151_AZOBR|nr:Uma2 family endonuclease [Azospirillum argentinense]QCO01786.1 Uma2 family endonuclease [Azospirillum argentinense]